MDDEQTGRLVPINLKRYKPVSVCRTCQYTLTHKKFHDELLHTTYFDENGLLTVGEVVRKYKVDKTLTYRNVITHLQRHIAPVKRYNDDKKAELAAKKLELAESEMVKAIAVPDATTEYERALDSTIQKFHQQLKDGKLKLTVNTGLQAIKIKADMESKNRDRKLDFLKAFSSMGQKSAED